MNQKPTALLLLNVGILCLFAVGVVSAEEAPSEEAVEAATNPEWWSNRQTGLIGGISGAALGIGGAMLGALGGAVVMRRLVMGMITGMLLLGIAGIVTLIVAVIDEQPLHVYQPFLLLGLLCTILPLSIRKSIAQRYEEKELRHMRAADLS